MIAQRNPKKRKAATVDSDIRKHLDTQAEPALSYQHTHCTLYSSCTMQIEAQKYQEFAQSIEVLYYLNEEGFFYLEKQVQASPFFKAHGW